MKKFKPIAILTAAAIVCMAAIVPLTLTAQAASGPLKLVDFDSYPMQYTAGPLDATDPSTTVQTWGYLYGGG